MINSDFYNQFHSLSITPDNVDTVLECLAVFPSEDDNEEDTLLRERITTQIDKIYTPAPATRDQNLNELLSFKENVTAIDMKEAIQKEFGRHAGIIFGHMYTHHEPKVETIGYWEDVHIGKLEYRDLLKHAVVKLQSRLAPPSHSSTVSAGAGPPAAPPRPPVAMGAPAKSFAPTWVGAGVLPYHIDSHGEAWVLLGKESGSRRFCDFGGGKDRGETPIETAKRECEEETRGLLRGRITDLTHDASIGWFYGLFLAHVADYRPITQDAFEASPGRDREKTHIAWVKASALFEALTTKTPNDGVKIRINHREELLRTEFVNLVRKALASPHPQERDLLSRTFRIELRKAA